MIVKSLTRSNGLAFGQIRRKGYLLGKRPLDGAHKPPRDNITVHTEVDWLVRYIFSQYKDQE